jgi:hypothetical protein
MMPEAAFLGGYAGIQLDAEGDVLNSRVNFDTGELLIDNVPVVPFGGGDTSDLARLSLPNVFQRETTFSGIRVGDIIPISADYTVLPTDAVVLADCSGGDLTITLQAATGNGQSIRIRKTDHSDNAVLIQPVLGDFIDTYTSISLDDFRRGILINDTLPHFWDMTLSPFIVYSDAKNVFTDVTTLAGLRLGPPKLITSDYNVQVIDFEILVDTSVHGVDINLFLPPSDGNGQFLHIKKIDTAPHMVNLNAQDGENIEGAAILGLSERGDDCLMIAGLTGYWDTIGPSFSDVMFLPFYGDKSRIMADGQFLLFNPDQSKYHTLTVRGSAGAEYITISAGVA